MTQMESSGVNVWISAIVFAVHSSLFSSGHGEDSDQAAHHRNEALWLARTTGRVLSPTGFRRVLSPQPCGRPYGSFFEICTDSQIEVSLLPLCNRKKKEAR